MAVTLPTPKPDYGDYDNPDLSMDEMELITASLERQSLRNRAQQLSDELYYPRMYIRYAKDIKDGPARPSESILVEGGMEYFNKHDIDDPDTYRKQPPVRDTPQIKKNARVNLPALEESGDGIHKYLDTTEKRGLITAGTEAASAAPPRTSSVSDNSLKPQRNMTEFLAELGLDFIQEAPTPPSQSVMMDVYNHAAQSKFQSPFPCNKIIVTDRLVILVADIRSTPAFKDYEFNAGADDVSLTLVLPVGTNIPVRTPVPKTLSFEVGPLRCTLFVRRAE